MEQKPGDVTSLNADYPAGCFQVLYVSNASYSSTDFSVFSLTKDNFSFSAG